LLQSDGDPAASGKWTGDIASHVVTSCDNRAASSLDFIARVWNDLPPHVREAGVTFVDAIVSRPVPNLSCGAGLQSPFDAIESVAAIVDFS
jgi:hypothetical protein